ncbi:hypothetical protein AOLI_G00130890 [Acnodon oligacanthus]
MMKCHECGHILNESFKFCPECGSRSNAQLSAGKSPARPSYQGKEREQKPPDPPTTRGSFSEQAAEDNIDPNLEEDANARRTDNESSANDVDTPQDGASLSSQTAHEEITTVPVDTASQSTQSSPTHGPIMSFSQSQPSGSAELPGNESKNLSRCLASGCSSQLPAESPCLKSSSEEFGQNPVKPSSLKSQPSEENVEKDVDSCPPEPEHMHSLNTDSVPANSSSTRPNNDSQSVQSAPSDSPAPSLTDQNEIKSPPSATEALKEETNHQIQSSRSGAMPAPGNSREEPDLKGKSHEELVNTTQMGNLDPQYSVPPQRSLNQTTESTERDTLQCTTAQGEKQKSSSSKKMFGPFSTEEIPKKPNADHGENKQQTKQKEVTVTHKEKKDQKNTRESRETSKQTSHPEKPEKRASSDQNDEAHFQQGSSKERKDRQSQTSCSQQESKYAVFFHAILSKDFKLDPSKDFVTLRFGGVAGNWKQDILKMEITRGFCREQDGYVVHGKLEISKQIAGVPIPYKYVVHKQSNNKPEYEYIYKHDAKSIVNRCLFIREDLLTKQGEWHQYDDIICAKPSEGVMDKFKNWFVNMKPDLVKGRNIAGYVMLETMYDILREWNHVNVRNFFVQLEQFFRTYSCPIVYEDKAKQWTSLQYGEAQVKELLKSFIQDKLSLLQTSRHAFSPDPLRAGFIFLQVCMKYLKMDQNLMQKIGSLLCLPKLSKEEFLPYWKNFLEPLQMESAAHAIRSFCLIAISCKTVNWILTVPLLHLLEGDSKPFEQNQLSSGQSFPVWSGFKGLRISESHLAESQHTRALIKAMEAHKHLLDIDQLLARSWMCMLGLNNLTEYIAVIPADALDVLIMLCFKLDGRVSYLDNEQLKLLLSHLRCKLKDQHARFKDTEYAELCLRKAVNLLETICKNYKEAHRYEVPLEGLKLITEIIHLKEHVNDQESHEAQEHTRTDILSEVKKIVREWLLMTFPNRLLNSSHSYTSFTNLYEIEVWSKLIELPFANKETAATWKKTFMSQFEGKLQQEKAVHQIEIYCNEVEKVNVKFPVLASCIENCALEAVHAVCQGGSENALFEKLKKHDLSKFGKLMSAIVLKAWPKRNDGEYQDGQELVVKHLLTWTTAKQIFQLQGSNGKLIDQLSDEAREQMAVASSAFSSVAEMFIRGNITIKILNQILEREDAFTELLKIDGLCDDGRCKDGRAVKTLLRKRREEVDNICHEKEMVECLLSVCQRLPKHITVDVADLEKKRQVIVEQMSLDDFMEVHQLDENTSEVTGVVTYFNLCDVTRKMAKRLHALKESYIFAMSWKNQAKSLSDIQQDDDETEPLLTRDAESYSLERIYQEIFEPCYSQHDRIYTSLKNETITFQEIDSVFEDYKGKYEMFRKELEIMCKINRKDDGRWITGRVRQIQQYHDLHFAVEAAGVIMDVREDLCPEGNFQILHRLLKFSTADFKEESLDCIDENLINAKEVLADITEARRLCLQELSLRRSFVKWVKEALTEISQLKVFVDLATISAGENAMDVDRVACFHDAVLGYSPLLYGLSVDSDFAAFKKALQKLWQALENDSNITKKLRDTARNLDWLRTVKESHGSVELSSLSLATAINARGVYTISARNQKKISMETALRLDVPEEHEEGQEIHCYSLEDVKDLQNKLMLMSGKAEQNNEVEHFTEVFDHVQRLAATFLDLLSAGNPFFRQWEAKITCRDVPLNSDVGPPGIILDFNLRSIQDKIIVEGNAVEQLPELCKKMVKYLSDWRKFVDKQRSENYYLNYFTAEQMVYLCEQLSLENVNEELEDSALMMLSFINPKVTSSNVWKIWNLVNEDVQSVGTVNVSLSEDSLNSSMDDFSDSVFGLKTLDLIWGKYVTDMKAFLTDTLDISSLGRLLDRLGSTLTENDEDDDQEEFMLLDPHERPIRRELPKGLMLGRPNLIVCPSEEVLASCISVYSASEYEPLPTYDEVLLCSAETPYEHVELFLRRCLTRGYMGEKIYCLLYADLLSYDVSNAVEQLFHRLLSVSKKDYKLVIICSLEREHAYMPSAFSQFKLHMVPREPLQKIQAYLSRHYTVSSEQASAATVFKDKQCIGIVSSKRAGVGE